MCKRTSNPSRFLTHSALSLAVDRIQEQQHSNSNSPQEAPPPPSTGTAAPQQPKPSAADARARAVLLRLLHHMANIGLLSTAIPPLTDAVHCSGVGVGVMCDVCVMCIRSVTTATYALSVTTATYTPNMQQTITHATTQSMPSSRWCTHPHTHPIHTQVAVGDPAALHKLAIITQHTVQAAAHKRNALAKAAATVTACVADSMVFLMEVGGSVGGSVGGCVGGGGVGVCVCDVCIGQSTCCA